MTSAEDRAAAAQQQEGTTAQTLWAVWHDRQLTATECAKRGVPNGTMHACIVHFTRHREMAALYEDRAKHEGWTVGEASGDGWGPELAILSAAVELHGPHHGVPWMGGGVLTQKYDVETRLGVELRERAGWCDWCDCRGFIAIALDVDRTELVR